MVVALRMVPMEERWMIPLPEEQETLGKYLRKLRTQRGLTQRQVADATGIEQNRLSQWENDQYTPRGRTLRPLETFFGLAPVGSCQRHDHPLHLRASDYGLSGAGGGGD